MSWFFSKKKQKDSTPDTPSEESESAGQDDNFIFVERHGKPAVDIGHDIAQSSGLYPSIHGATPYPSLTPYSQKQQSAGETLHYLHDIPFKFCRELEKTFTNDLELEKLRLSEFMLLLERLNLDNYEYDFNLERGIVAEVDSRQIDNVP